MLLTTAIGLVDKPLVLERSSDSFVLLDVIIQSFLNCDTATVLLSADVQVRNRCTIVLKTEFSAVRGLHDVSHSVKGLACAIFLPQVHVVARLLTL
jgi:hypothetical protein